MSDSNDNNVSPPQDADAEALQQVLIDDGLAPNEAVADGLVKVMLFILNDPEFIVSDAMDDNDHEVTWATLLSVLATGHTTGSFAAIGDSADILGENIADSYLRSGVVSTKEAGLFVSRFVLVLTRSKVLRLRNVPSATPGGAYCMQFVDRILEGVARVYATPAQA